MTNNIKNVSLLLCVITICFYQMIQPMQQAGAASRAVAEDIAKAVSDFFSQPENGAVQHTLTVDPIDIAAIIENPEFQASIAEALEDEMRNSSSDCDSDSQDSNSLCQQGTPVSEIIKKIRDSKLAQWLGFDTTQESLAEEATPYTKDEKEQIYIALHGRMQQENLSLTPEIWNEITNANPQLLKDLLHGFYGKTSPAELEKSIEQIKTILFFKKTPNVCYPFAQPQKQQKFWESTYKAPQQPLAKSVAQEQKKRVISQAPLPPKRKSNKTTNCSRLEAQKRLAENQTLQKLMQDEVALDALIKKAAIIFKQHELQKEESAQRSSQIERATSNYEQIAKQKEASELAILKKIHLHQQEQLQNEIIERYDDLRKELKKEQKTLTAAMQESEKKAIAQQHQREQLAKQQKERIEQNELDKKLQNQYKKKQSYIKKRDAAEKQKLAQELEELQERNEKLAQKNKIQKQQEEKAARESKHRAEQKELKQKMKKQKKLKKTSNCDQKQMIDQETSIRISEEQQAQMVYEQLMQNFQLATKNIIAQQQKLKDQRTEIEQDAINQKTTYEQEQNMFYKQLQQTEQKIRSQIADQQAQEISTARLFETLPDININPTDLEQKQYNDAIAKKIGRKRDEINIKKDEQKHRNALEDELEQQLKKIQETIDAFNKEAATARLFETLPDTNINPTDLEQKQYNDAIAKKIGHKRDEINIQKDEQKHRNVIEDELGQQLKKLQEHIDTLNKEAVTARLFETLPDTNINPTDLEQKQYNDAIAKKIGRKRDEINFQKDEQKHRNGIEGELGQQLKKLQEIIDTFNKKVLKQQQFEKEQDIANLFENLPDSDSITSATDIPLPEKAETPQPTNQSFDHHEIKPNFDYAAKTPDSYAKEPFSDENAQAVQDMFKQYQPDNPFGNRAFQEKSTDDQMPLADEETDQSLQPDTTEAKIDQTTDQPSLHRNQLSLESNQLSKEVKTTATKKQSKNKEREQKKSSPIESNRSNTVVTPQTYEPAAPNIEQNYTSKNSLPVEKKSYHPNIPYAAAPYNIAYANDRVGNGSNNASYQGGYYPADAPTNQNSVAAALPHLATQKTISSSSKQLNPEDITKTTADAYQEMVMPEQFTTDKQETSMTERSIPTKKEDLATENPSEKINTFQNAWNNLLTFFESLFIALKLCINIYFF